MKYLKIHKLLWFILVLLSILYDLSFVFISSGIHFLWDFKFKFNYYWRRYHEDFELTYNPVTKEFDSKVLSQKSIKETFMSRLNYWKDKDDKKII